MLNLGHIAFTTPWLLGFFAALPLLWWLLRLTPPAPKKIVFPALALLKGLAGREETPTRSPWWLLLLRLVIVALVIAAFAQPILDPLPATGQAGALLIAVDNDWAAARDWDARQSVLRDLIVEAGRDHRHVLLLKTAPSAYNEPLTTTEPMASEVATAAINQVMPEPWPADWVDAVKLLPDVHDVGEVVWVASGVGSVDAKIFYDALKKIAPVKVYGTSSPLYTLMPPVNEGDEMSIAVQRAAADAPADVAINAVAKDGSNVAHWTASFADGSPRAVVKLAMPSELRNQIARFEIEAPRTAASTVLLDSAWEHRAVGIVGDATELDHHSLLSEIYYIDRALKPYADFHIDTLGSLVKSEVPIILLTDASSISDDDVPVLTAWIQRGGILLRFAGDRFAASAHDKDRTLLPVPMREGDRSMGGALTWGAPQSLRDMPETSPFHKLIVPPDVTVQRQVLAEPSLDTAAKTWAALADGTPLVTAATMGQGISVLFHIPARPSWSTLPLSGLFVEMLQRTLQLSHAARAIDTKQATSLRPSQVLDAFGDEHAPSATVLPLDADTLHATKISPQHPPGLYGAGADNVALNLGAAIGQPELLRHIAMDIYAPRGHEADMQPYLLAAAFLLLLIDFVVSLRLRGLLKFAALLLGVFCFMHTAEATTGDANGVELTSKTYLAYVRTGDAGTDRVSELGLRGLAAMIQNRTSIDHIGVAKVDPDIDDLAFYPLLYWPVTVNEPPLSAEGARRVTYYLHHGGMIMFDAADGDMPPPVFLQRVLAGVDFPPLIRLPDNHVLKRTYYLLDDFPGRFTGHDFWLEPEAASATDGVASVLYGSNGWAAAWAMDDAGRPLYPCTPDGEAQRERAFRFGVNLVIYALTGNYKNDQLQTNALLRKMER